MPVVVLTPTVIGHLDRLIQSHSLPPDTRDRLRRSLRALVEFPRLGSPLEGRWSGFRFVLGPWRWMIVVYEWNPVDERVLIVAILDARSARSPTAVRSRST